MNPNRGEASQANFETPPPLGPESEDNSLDQEPEAPADGPEKAGNQSLTPTLPLLPDDIPAAGQPALPIPANDQSGQAQAHAAIADGDHIPPVWIDKTKSVIAQTQQDPYIQKNEVSKIKADYIQKRFNKQIKVDSGGE